MIELEKREKLERNGFKVDPVTKTIEVAESKRIGIKLWGLLDYAKRNGYSIIRIRGS